MKRVSILRISSNSIFAMSCLILLGSKCSPSHDSLSTDLGKRAMVFTEEIISFGPRPPQSPALEKVRAWLQTRASQMNLSATFQEFKAQTPLGQMKMVNVSMVIPGTQPGRSQVILVAHYDSKKFDNFAFVGANDAASSVGLLLALAESLPKGKLPFDVVVLFVDGEEALQQWSRSDSLYGSRYYVQTHPDKSLIKAAIIVDMIGDADLQLIRSSTSDGKLTSLLESALKDLQYESLLDQKSTMVEDDHTPFVDAGIPTLHLMDFTYGGKESPGTYWHTYADTMEHISEDSLNRIGKVIARLLEKLAD